MITLSVSVTTKRDKEKWFQCFDVMEGELLSGCGLIHKNGDHITNQLVEEFEFMYPEYTCYSPQIKKVLDESRECFFGEGSHKHSAVHNTVVELDVSEDSLQKHKSCWNLPGEVVTRRSVKNLGIPQSDVLHRLRLLDSETSDFFTTNTCSVCLSSYKEILESSRHIVLPQCGHPICCCCCDKMLRLDPKCPLCREYLDINEIEPMRFELNLELHSENSKVFL